MKKMYRTELRRTANKDWYFRVVADNGRIICHSEGYKNRIDCKVIMENLGYNLMHPIIKNINADGLTIIHVKNNAPEKSTWDKINKMVEDTGLKGHVAFLFSPEGEFRQLTEEEMNELGWTYDADKDKGNELRIVE
jgi:uncharacterized protein YegP (UPF0339 family)